MADAPPTEDDSAAEEAQIDWAVLNLLLGDHVQRLCSVEEVVREYGSRQDALDGLDRLHGAGLIHRLGGFVFPTVAANRFFEIAQ
jgi:hypothetical protein